MLICKWNEIPLLSHQKQEQHLDRLFYNSNLLAIWIPVANTRGVWRIPCTERKEKLQILTPRQCSFQSPIDKIFYPWKKNLLCLEFFYSYAKYICNYKRCLVLEVYGRFLRVSLLVLVNIFCLKRGKERLDWFENLFHHNSLFCRLQLKEKLFN